MNSPASTVCIKGVCAPGSGFVHKIEKFKEMGSLQKSREKLQFEESRGYRLSKRGKN